MLVKEAVASAAHSTSNCWKALTVLASTGEGTGSLACAFSFCRTIFRRDSLLQPKQRFPFLTCRSRPSATSTESAMGKSASLTCRMTASPLLPLSTGQRQPNAAKRTLPLLQQLPPLRHVKGERRLSAATSQKISKMSGRVCHTATAAVVFVVVRSAIRTGR